MQIKPQQCQHDKANFFSSSSFSGRGKDQGEQAIQHNLVLWKSDIQMCI